MSYNDKQKIVLSKFYVGDVISGITSNSISNIMDELQKTPTIMEKMDEINIAVDKVKYLLDEKIDLDVIYPSLTPTEELSLEAQTTDKVLEEKTEKDQCYNCGAETSGKGMGVVEDDETNFFAPFCDNCYEKHNEE